MARADASGIAPPPFGFPSRDPIPTPITGKHLVLMGWLAFYPVLGQRSPTLRRPQKQGSLRVRHRHGEARPP